MWGLGLGLEGRSIFLGASSKKGFYFALDLGTHNLVGVEAHGGGCSAEGVAWLALRQTAVERARSSLPNHVADSSGGVHCMQGAATSGLRADA